MLHIINAEAVRAAADGGGGGKATEPRAEPEVRFLDDFRSIENHIQAVLCLHGSLTTGFILVLSFVHLVLNHSSTYRVFCLHVFFPNSQKTE